MDNEDSLKEGTDDSYLRNVDSAYNFCIDTLLYYQRLFEYSGDVFSLLALPYNMFQDLIIKQIELKKKEIERMNSQSNSKKNSGIYNKRPIPAVGFKTPKKLRR